MCGADTSVAQTHGRGEGTWPSGVNVCQSLQMILTQVSGEYAMLCRGSKAEAFDLRTVVLESVESMRRAGMCVARIRVC